ncbi:MAG: DUF4169 family protein [Proteobacteria bacterium]|nr:DUF4169 family protein [Pseudomonadota bacterium]
MADIINLRKARKARARAEADQRAVENRILHGMTRGEKERIRLEKEQAEAKITGLRLVGAAAPDKPN